MNSILEEMDALVEQFYEDCDRFIERMKEYEDKEKQMCITLYNKNHNGRKQE